MYKKLLLLGAVSGLLAAVASIIYQKVYAASLGADFPQIVKSVNIVAINVISGLLAATGFWLLNKWLKNNTEIVFNLLFVTLSFASIIPAFGFRLPVTIETPELFPGLVVPMHFFPALAWLTLKPLFVKSYQPYQKVFA
jgi:hypothetical protein